MDLKDEDFKEFVNEATELLDSSESSLLAIDQGGEFGSNYDSIFRTFHSLKGAAGMMDLTALQGHMHQLENLFTTCKANGNLSKEQIDFFLRGVDGARSILEGKTIQFEYKFGASPSASAKPAPSAPSAQPAKVIPIAKAKKIIGKAVVVDDEPDIVELLTDVLVTVGFEVKGYTDPLVAVKELKSAIPDVVLTDFSMPKMNGMQLMAEMSKIDAELPVIYVSGYITKEVLMDSLAYGVYGAIEKPFDEKRVTQIAINAAKRYRLSKLLNRSINLLMYQFSDLDDFLKKEGKEDVRKAMNAELQQVLEQRRELKLTIKKAA